MLWAVVVFPNMLCGIAYRCSSNAVLFHGRTNCLKQRGFLYCGVPQAAVGTWNAVAPIFETLPRLLRLLQTNSNPSSCSSSREQQDLLI